MTRTPAVDHREGGFTLIEVTITAMILLIVMAGLLGLLESQTKSEHAVQDVVATQEDMRLAVVTVARDIRACAVTDAQPVQVDLDVYDSPSSSTATHVRWRLDTSGAQSTLEREVVATNGSTTLTYSVPVVSGNKLFSYYSPNNRELVTPTTPMPVYTTPNASTSTFVASCTERVSVNLGGATGATATAQFDETSDIAVRNSTATASLCP